MTPPTPQLVPGRREKRGRNCLLSDKWKVGARYQCFDEGSGKEVVGVVRNRKCNGSDEGTEVSFRYRSYRKKVLTIR